MEFKVGDIIRHKDGQIFADGTIYWQIVLNAFLGTGEVGKWVSIIPLDRITHPDHLRHYSALTSNIIKVELTELERLYYGI